MKRTILITGASSGIGLDAAKILDQNGFDVIATVRKIKDQQHLNQLFSGRVRTLILDVTDFEQVDFLPERLRSEFNVQRLDGLVNNAGIVFGGPFALQSFSEIQKVFQTNVLALMKVTQVLLPHLGVTPLLSDSSEIKIRSLPARIVNISSVSGISALPFLSVYAASKYAIEGFSQALRNELSLFKVKVIVVRPGSIKTPIWEKGLQAVQSHPSTGKSDRNAYTQSMEAFARLVKKEVNHALPVEKVSECVLHAMTAEKPKRVYEPIPGKWKNRFLPFFLPASYMDKVIQKFLKLN